MELEGRLSGRGGEEPKKVKDEGRENVAVIPVTGREVDSTRLTISVNSSPRETAGGESEQKRKGLLSRRGSPPAGPASLPALSSNNNNNNNNNKGGNKGKKEVQVFQLEQHCKNLEEQLDDVSNFSNCDM